MVWYAVKINHFFIARWVSVIIHNEKIFKDGYDVFIFTAISTDLSSNNHKNVKK